MALERLRQSSQTRGSSAVPAQEPAQVLRHAGGSQPPLPRTVAAAAQTTLNQFAASWLPGPSIAQVFEMQRSQRCVVRPILERPSESYSKIHHRNNDATTGSPGTTPEW